jgi:hypothetical protein
MEENLSAKPLEKQETGEGTITFKWFFSTLLGVWPWFLISVIVALSIGQLYLRYTTPIYSTSAEIILNDARKSDAIMLEGLGLNSGSAKVSMDNEMRLLRSKTMMKTVVKELNLNVRYLVAGRLKTAELYGDRPFDFHVLQPEPDSVMDYFSCNIEFAGKNHYILSDAGKRTKHRFGDTIICSAGQVLVTSRGRVSDDQFDKYQVLVSPIIDAAAKYVGSLHVSMPSKNTSTITIGMVDEIALRGADVVNKLIEVYVNETINDKNRVANNTIAFIEDRLRDVSGDLSGIEGEIEGFKRSNELIDINNEADYLFNSSNLKE